MTAVINIFVCMLSMATGRRVQTPGNNVPKSTTLIIPGSREHSRLQNIFRTGPARGLQHLLLASAPVKLVMARRIAHRRVDDAVMYYPTLEDLKKFDRERERAAGNQIFNDPSYVQLEKTNREIRDLKVGDAISLLEERISACREANVDERWPHFKEALTTLASLQTIGAEDVEEDEDEPIFDALFGNGYAESEPDDPDDYFY